MIEHQKSGGRRKSKSPKQDDWLLSTKSIVHLPFQSLHVCICIQQQPALETPRKKRIEKRSLETKSYGKVK